MRLRACLIAAVLSSAPISPAMANPVGYGVAFDQLYRIETSPPGATYIGEAGNFGGQPYGLLKGLTFGPGNTLYAISDSLTQKPIVTLNTANGRATYLSSLNLSGGTGQFKSLDFASAFTCDGQMWLTSATTRKLWRVNPATGQSTLVATLAETLTGLAARGNELFAAGGRGNNSLYKVNTQTGTATLIGGFGAASSGWISTISLSFDANGTLWSVLNYLPPAPGGSTLVDWSDLARIDPATGLATVLGPITGPESLLGIGITGFTVGQTPCALPPPGGSTPPPATLPSSSTWSLAILGLLLFAASASRISRRRSAVQRSGGNRA